MITILMISAKLATLGLLKIKIFQNKVYDIIIFEKFTRFYNITQTSGRPFRTPS